jgi:TRAP-type uncharacterized transport system substrate-binding protein
MFRCVSVLILAGLYVSLGGCSNQTAVTAPVVKRSKEQAADRTSSVGKIPARSLADQKPDNSISVISGEESGTYSRTVDGLAEILSRNQMRLRPIASQGPLQDLLSLLHRPDIDTAIVQADALEGLAGYVQAAARERLRYLFQVSSKAVHVLAPRDITDIRQLEGRKVNIDQPGSGTHLTAILMFQRLGIKPEFTTFDQETAFQRLQSGEIQASILLASHPSTDVLAFPSSGRFHLVPLSLEGGTPNYRSGQFTADEYPHLIDTGQRVDTIEVGRILAVRDWPEGSPRYKRLARLTEMIDAHLDELQQSSQDRQRGDVTLQEVSGWQRFEPARRLLDKRIRTADEQRAFERLVAASGVCSTPIPTAASERLYQDFMDWRKARERVAPSQASDANIK